MIKVHSEADKICVAKAHEAAQDHVFDRWDDLEPEAQRSLIRDLQSVNFPLVKRLIHQHLQGRPDLDLESLKPPAVEELPRPGRAAGGGTITYEQALGAGEEALAAGKVALVMLSGDAGSAPLGEPTGMLPVGPVTGKSLFQLQAEKVRALNRRYRTALRWYIVAHPQNLDATVAFFREHGFFGLSPSTVQFLPQPQLPLVDRRGKFLMAEPGKLALSPSGHGGVLEEFSDREGLARMTSQGVEHFFFFQVENALVRIADPLFLGYHLLSGSEVSSKSIQREQPDEELGVFCQAGCATGVVEYSELPHEEKTDTRADGHLIFDRANITVHIFSAAFFERMVREQVHLPFHAIERCVPHVDRRGRKSRPTEPNCIEFSCFLFDALWTAKSTSVLAVPREDEFSPIRNIGGADSPQTAQRDLSRLYARWLKNSGASFVGSAEKNLPAVEISPLFALDEDELRSKIELPLEIDGDLLLSGG